MTAVAWLADHIQRYYPHCVRVRRGRRRVEYSTVQFGPQRQTELPL